MNVGVSVEPVTDKLLSVASFDFLCTVTVYVLVAPLCDVTTTLIALFPTFKVFFPVPAIVATPLVDSAVTVVSVTLLATVHVYDVVSLVNVGDNVQKGN